MKINRVEIIPVNIPYKMPFRVSTGAVTSGNFIIVKIQTDEGIEGIRSTIGAPLLEKHQRASWPR